MGKKSGSTQLDLDEITTLIEEGNIRPALKKAKKYLNKADSRIAKGKLPPDEFGTYVMTKFLEGDCYLRIKESDKALRSYNFLLDKIQFKKDDPKFRGAILRRIAEANFQKEEMETGIKNLEMAMNAFFDGKEIGEGITLGLNLLKLLVSVEKYDETKKLGKFLLKKSKKIKDNSYKLRVQAQIQILMWDHEPPEKKRELLLKLASKYKNDSHLSSELATRALLSDFAIERDKMIFETNLKNLLEGKEEKLLLDLLRLIIKHELCWNDLIFLEEETRKSFEEYILKMKENEDLGIRAFYMTLDRILRGEDAKTVSLEDLKLSLELLKSLPKRSPLMEPLGHLFITTLKNLSTKIPVEILDEAKSIFLLHGKVCDAISIQHLIIQQTREVEHLEVLVKLMKKCKDINFRKQLLTELRSSEWFAEIQLPEQLKAKFDKMN